MRISTLVSACMAACVSCSGISISDSGNKASFIADDNGCRGISFSARDGISSASAKPAEISVYRDGVPTRLGAGYETIRKKGKSVTAEASIKDSSVIFHFVDTWTVDPSGLHLDRCVAVQGENGADGFDSVIEFYLEKGLRWDDVKPVIPGIIYGAPHTSKTSKGGSRYAEAHFYSLREDCLAAPEITLTDSSNRWIMLLDEKPDGTTSWEETTKRDDSALTNASFGFGTMEIRDRDDAVSLSFRFPGTTEDFPQRFPFAAGEDKKELSKERVRLHPVSDGFKQRYRLVLSSNKADSFNGVEKDSWRNAWNILQPKVESVDIELIKKDLIDHLSDRVINYEGRSGIPFVIDAQSGRPGSFRPAVSMYRRSVGKPEVKDNVKWAQKLGIDIDPNADELDIWPYAVFGFCGKHMEIARQFYRESDRDSSERGRKLRSQADAIMNTFVNNFPLDPPVGEGISLRTGRVGNIHGGSSFSLRPIGEDLSTLLDLVNQEEAQGREHEEWIDYCRKFADWLLPYQREDGSFPADWQEGEISDQSGSKTYGVVSMYAKLGQMTGESRYSEAALKAAEYMWQNYGAKGVYLGATGQSDVADKESGMLNMDAFLCLYEINGDRKWLERACAAADYTESWIWIWNVPMPTGADPAVLGWKPGVNTTGVNGIGSNDLGGVDQYLDWAVPHYAKLYSYTGDEHYKEVAYILLHGTKAMLAYTGRTYDLAGPGWQQEHWRMYQNRGTGGHRTWLPWISINHLNGITSLEDFDESLYKTLTENK